MSKDNYLILYKINNRFKYRPDGYWTIHREFIDDPLLLKPKFIKDKLLSNNYSVFTKNGPIA